MAAVSSQIAAIFAEYDVCVWGVRVQQPLVDRLSAASQASHRQCCVHPDAAVYTLTLLLLLLQ
jgi:hypothetical protein